MEIRKEDIMPKTKKKCGRKIIEMGFGAQSVKKCGRKILIHDTDAQKDFLFMKSVL